MFGFLRKQSQSARAGGSWRIPDLLPWWSHKAAWRDWTSAKAIREGYERNVWVYACMRKRAEAVATVPAVVLRDVQGEEVQDWDHPLTKLMHAPNPEMDGATMMQIVQGSLDACGNAYLHVIRGGSGGAVPLELWPIPADAMEARSRPGNGRYVDHYRYDWQGVVKDIPAEDVLHLMFTHPEDRMSGISPLKAAGISVDLDNEASQWQKISLQNRGVPDGIFRMSGEVGPEEWEEARRQVRQEYTGSSKAREPWVLANVDWQQMSLAPAELDFGDARDRSRIEICAAYEVPPPMVGIYDDATLANIETARKIFWRDTILPMLSDYAAQITRALAPAFGEGVRLTFDTSNVSALQDSMQERIELAERMFGMGVPLSQINDRLELGLDTDEIPGADVGYLPSGLLPTDLDMSVIEQRSAQPLEETKRLHELAYGKRIKAVK